MHTLTVFTGIQDRLLNEIHGFDPWKAAKDPHKDPFPLVLFHLQTAEKYHFWGVHVRIRMIRMMSLSLLQDLNSD